MRVIVADSLEKCNLAGDNSINAIPRIVGAVVDTDILGWAGARLERKLWSRGRKYRDRWL